MQADVQSSSDQQGYLVFPPKEEILRSLQEAAPESAKLGGVFEAIASRIAGQTYDSAAFAFILMEILYDHQEGLNIDTPELLPQCILALSRDPELARDTVAAYEEIQRSIGA